MMAVVAEIAVVVAVQLHRLHPLHFRHYLLLLHHYNHPRQSNPMKVWMHVLVVEI